MLSARLAQPTSPSHRFAMGPSLSPQWAERGLPTPQRQQFGLGSASIVFSVALIE